MKSLQKAEMLKRDQVLLFRFRDLKSDYNINLRISTVGPCTSGTRRSSRIHIAMGRAAFLFIPRSVIPVSHHGIPPWW